MSVRNKEKQREKERGGGKERKEKREKSYSTYVISLCNFLKIISRYITLTFYFIQGNYYHKSHK